MLLQELWYLGVSMLTTLSKCKNDDIDIPQWYPSRIILVICWPGCLPGPLHTTALTSCCMLCRSVTRLLWSKGKYCALHILEYSVYSYTV